jgi:hypothetical protein
MRKLASGGYEEERPRRVGGAGGETVQVLSGPLCQSSIGSSG